MGDVHFSKVFNYKTEATNGGYVLPCNEKDDVVTVSGDSGTTSRAKPAPSCGSSSYYGASLTMIYHKATPDKSIEHTSRSEHEIFLHSGLGAGHK